MPNVPDNAQVTDMSQTAALGRQTGFLSRVSQAVRYAISGVTPSTWMSPGQPIKPQAQEGAYGRRFDYPVGANTTYTPRATERTTFQQLRAVADNCDVVRLCIETRKDQMERQRWKIQRKDGKVIENDPKVAEITQMLRRPDGRYSWGAWVRMLVEEVLVIDAPSVVPRRKVNGSLAFFELIDGSLIKPLVDAEGRVPAAPDPAYQQVIKGLPAVDYTADELVYQPRNPRVHKFYGYSPVEQILLTINIAVRRALGQLQYFTEGNIPEAFASVPKEWSPQQIEQFQAYWDAIVEGDQAQKRKVRFVPGDTKVTNVREAPLKDEFDEWIARVACYAFSLPPTPFVKQMNRATAETADDAATEEGLGPLKEWLADLVNLLIGKYLDASDYEFSWADEKALDPKEQAEIHDAYLRNLSMTPNEVRKELGRDPIPGLDEPMVFTATGVMPLSIALERAKEPPPPPPGTLPPGGDKPGKGAPVDDEDDAGKGAPVAKASSGGKKAEEAAVFVLPGGKRPEAVDASGTTDVHQHAAAAVSQTVTETKLAEQIAAALGLSAEEVAQAIGPAIEAGQGEAAVVALVDQLALEGIAQVQPELLAALEANTKQGAEQGLVQLSIDAGAGITEQVNEKAISWAAQRAGDLIKTDGTGGELVDATRTLIRATVEQATREGWSTEQLAKALREHYAFSPQRAQVIARTELAMAESQGNLQAYIASGVVQKKRWILDPDPCPVCIANAAQGDIPLLQAFQGGVMTAPQHPNCRCAIAPVID